MRLISVIFLVLFVGAISAASVYILTASNEKFPDGTQSIPYLFVIADVPGVDTRKDVFRLGQLGPGGASWRTLQVEAGIGSMTQEAQAKRQVLVLARGKGSEWIIIQPSITTLPAEVNISLRPSLDAPLGTYQGTLYVVPYSPNK